VELFFRGAAVMCSEFSDMQSRRAPEKQQNVVLLVSINRSPLAGFWNPLGMLERELASSPLAQAQFRDVGNDKA
jgi:hypothetical protein